MQQNQEEFSVEKMAELLEVSRSGYYRFLKREQSEREKEIREEAKTSIFEYIETFYNRKRMHSTLGYMSPEDFEKNQGKKHAEA